MGSHEGRIVVVPHGIVVNELLHRVDAGRQHFLLIVRIGLGLGLFPSELAIGEADRVSGPVVVLLFFTQGIGGGLVGEVEHIAFGEGGSVGHQFPHRRLGVEVDGNGVVGFTVPLVHLVEPFEGRLHLDVVFMIPEMDGEVVFRRAVFGVCIAGHCQTVNIHSQVVLEGELSAIHGVGLILHPIVGIGIVSHESGDFIVVVLSKNAIDVNGQVHGSVSVAESGLVARTCPMLRLTVQVACEPEGAEQREEQ